MSSTPTRPVVAADAGDMVFRLPDTATEDGTRVEFKYACPYCQKPRAFDFTDLMTTEAMVPVGQVMKQRCYTCMGTVHLQKVAPGQWAAKRHIDIHPPKRGRPK